METTNAPETGNGARPQVVALSSAEDAWLENLMATAEAKGYLDSIDTLSDAFEEAREEWSSQPQHSRPEPGKIIHLYAVAFGQQLAMDHDLDWAGLRKSDTIEIVLWDPEGEVTLLPISMVEKRWHDPAVRSLRDLYDQSVASLTAGQ
ncbi:DUF3806 domain-containing protein [Corynebacterium halotolerans]|uniref:DUF3806 domain-containing protein n=1 Tax=Corynebacterium halotolerans TaxID=225326 RepID=UPI003CE836A0